MSVPPRPTEHDPGGWEVARERPAERAPQTKPDKRGIALVAIVLAGLVVALLLLVLL
jgi:hypothetical protein